MKHIVFLLLACVAGYAADSETDKTKTNKTEKAEASIFPDKKLEAAVRKFVFDKRDTDKPITEADVANLSTIQGVGMGIKDLSGLEKCRSLASLDLAKNAITNLGPIAELTSIQVLEPREQPDQRCCALEQDRGSAIHRTVEQPGERSEAARRADEHGVAVSFEQ